MANCKQQCSPEERRRLVEKPLPIVHVIGHSGSHGGVEIDRLDETGNAGLEDRISAHLTRLYRGNRKPTLSEYDHE